MLGLMRNSALGKCSDETRAQEILQHDPAMQFDEMHRLKRWVRVKDQYKEPVDV